MEFLVEFKVNVPTGASESEVKDREKAEASATAKLADEGHLVRLWRRTVTSGDRPIVGLFRADSETELDSMIGALPLYEWLDVSVTPLKSHANDPADATVPRRPEPRTSTSLPDPRLTKVYRLEATLGQPIDIGDAPGGHRRSCLLPAGHLRALRSTGSCSQALAPIGRSDSRTVPRLATSATRCRLTRAICSMCNHEGCATAVPRSSHDLGAVRTSTPASTPSAPQPRSRPPPPISTG